MSSCSILVLCATLCWAAPAFALTAYEGAPVAVRMQIVDMGYTGQSVWMVAEDDTCAAYRLYLTRQTGSASADHGYYRYVLSSPSTATWNHVSGGSSPPGGQTWTANGDDGLTYGFSGLPAGTGTIAMQRATPVEWRYATIRYIDLEGLLFGLMTGLAIYLIFDGASALLRAASELFGAR